MNIFEHELNLTPIQHRILGNAFFSVRVLLGVMPEKMLEIIKEISTIKEVIEAYESDDDHYDVYQNNFARICYEEITKRVTINKDGFDSTFASIVELNLDPQKYSMYDFKPLEFRYFSNIFTTLYGSELFKYNSSEVIEIIKRISKDKELKDVYKDSKGKYDDYKVRLTQAIFLTVMKDIRENPLSKFKDII